MNGERPQNLHLKRGDVVSFRPVKGMRRTYEVPVLEITDGYLGTLVYADIRFRETREH